MENSKIDKFADALVPAFEKSLNEDAQNIKRPYVVKYFNKGELIGYHSSTFCQITEDILNAKRYEGNPTTQIETISRNLDSVFNSPNMPDGSLTKIFALPVYKRYWKDYNREDIFIDFEHLPENVEPQVFKVKRIQ